MAITNLLHGFKNRDIRGRLFPPVTDPLLRWRQSHAVGRHLRQRDVGGLIGKIRRTQCWWITDRGQIILSTCIRLHYHGLLARELGPRGIPVNAITPGFPETDLSSSLPEARRCTAVGRLGKLEAVVGAIDLLPAKSAGFSTGQTFKVDRDSWPKTAYSSRRKRGRPPSPRKLSHPSNFD